MKKKFALKGLSVQSFVTSVESELKGGTGCTYYCEGQGVTNRPCLVDTPLCTCGVCSVAMNCN